MGIRSAAKAIIVDDGKVLLNKCVGEIRGEHYELPGGGQNQYENLHEAVIRECLEETGYTVRPVRFAALCEDIFMNHAIREKHPDYSHRVLHIFLCELADDNVNTPTETDYTQISCEWVEIAALSNIKLLPKAVGDNIRTILDGTAPGFLGTEYIN